MTGTLPAGCWGRPRFLLGVPRAGRGATFSNKRAPLAATGPPGRGAWRRRRGRGPLGALDTAGDRRWRPVAARHSPRRRLGGGGGGGGSTPAAHPERWWPPGRGPGRIAGPDPARCWVGDRRPCTKDRRPPSPGRSTPTRCGAERRRGPWHGSPGALADRLTGTWRRRPVRRRPRRSSGRPCGRSAIRLRAWFRWSMRRGR